MPLPLEDTGCDCSCLCSFRRRLLEQAQERLVCAELLGTIQALGGVTQRGPQRPAALAVLGAGRPWSALETVRATLRLAGRALAQAAPDWVAQELPASCVQACAPSRADYRLRAQERAAALQQVGQEGVWLRERLEATPPVALRERDAVQVLRTVGEQRYERGAGRVPVRAQTVDGTEVSVTPHDPGVRAGEKRGTKWRGDKAHLTETAEPDAPRLLTDVTTAAAPSGDSAAWPLRRPRLAERALLPEEQDWTPGTCPARPWPSARTPAARWWARPGPTPPRNRSRAPPSLAPGTPAGLSVRKDTPPSHGARAPSATAAAP